MKVDNTGERTIITEQGSIYPTLQDISPEQAHKTILAKQKGLDEALMAALFKCEPWGTVLTNGSQEQNPAGVSLVSSPCFPPAPHQLVLLNLLCNQ